MRSHGEEAWLRQQHYAAYLQIFRTGDSHLRGPNAAIWLVRLGAEQDNLPAAFAEAFATGQQMTLEGAFAEILASMQSQEKQKRQ